jgi:hypothetical protein
MATVAGYSMSLSIDGGLSWQKKKIIDSNPGGYCTIVNIAAAGSSTLVAAGKDVYSSVTSPLIAYSYDNGFTWTKMTGAFITGSHINQAQGEPTAQFLDIASDGVGFIGCGSYFTYLTASFRSLTLPFFASSSDGVNWTQYEPIFPSSITASAASDRDSQATLIEWVPSLNKYVSTVQGLSNTADQGKTFVMMSADGITWTSSTIGKYESQPVWINFNRVVPSTTGVMLWSLGAYEGFAYVSSSGGWISGSTVPNWGQSGQGYMAQAGIVYVNSKFIAPSPDSGYHKTMSSSNGLAWVTSSTTSQPAGSVSVLSGSTIVLFGQKSLGSYYTSGSGNVSYYEYTTAFSVDEGQTWTYSSGGPSGTTNEAWYVNGRIAVAPLAP